MKESASTPPPTPPRPNLPKSPSIADFDENQRAFYYVRVIEISKPRRTAYDAKFFDMEMSDEVPMTTRDRAYTSPIWYTP